MLYFVEKGFIFVSYGLGVISLLLYSRYLLRLTGLQGLFEITYSSCEIKYLGSNLHVKSALLSHVKLGSYGGVEANRLMISSIKWHEKDAF